MCFIRVIGSCEVGELVSSFPNCSTGFLDGRVRVSGPGETPSPSIQSTEAHATGHNLRRVLNVRALWASVLSVQNFFC